MELFTPSALPRKVPPEPSHGVTSSRPAWATSTPSHGLIPQLFCYFPCFSTQNLTLHTNVQTDTQPFQYYFASPAMEGAPLGSDARQFLAESINSTHQFLSPKISGSGANFTCCKSKGCVNFHHLPNTWVSPMQRQLLLLPFWWLYQRNLFNLYMYVIYNYIDNIFNLHNYIYNIFIIYLIYPTYYIWLHIFNILNIFEIYICSTYTYI